MSLITAQDIEDAARRTKGVVQHTPLLPFYYPHEGEKVWLKPENFQPVGSFKLRGAYNKITKLVEEGYSGTIVAFSSGNHAQGAAYAAKKHGLKAIIVMPVNCPEIKIKRTKAHGAEVMLYDPIHDSREQIAKDLAEKYNAVVVPPYDDPDIIAGSGTIGFEIYEDCPEVDLVLTCIGGGGHISGVASGIKFKNPNVKVFGVEPELAADAKASLEAGRIMEGDDEKAQTSIADGIRTHQVGDLAFEHLKERVDGIMTVTDNEIIATAKTLLFESKIVVEPTGAVALAAYLYHREKLPEAKNIAVILSGGSADPTFISKIASPDE